jgi:hypothetical protein
MDERTEYCISAELNYARAKFPGNKHKLAALMEEVGELAQALMHHDRGKASAAEVYAEAIQVAVMAIRIAEEGTEEHSYQFDHAHYQAFNVNKSLEEVKERALTTNYSTVDSDPIIDEIATNINRRVKKQDDL